MHKTNIIIRPNDLDALCHVNNAIYLEYLELGRVDWLSKNEFIVLKKDVISVVSKIEINYVRPVTLDMDVFVETELFEPEIQDINKLTFKAVFKQRVIDITKNVYVSSIVEVCFINMKSKGPIMLKDSFSYK